MTADQDLAGLPEDVQRAVNRIGIYVDGKLLGDNLDIIRAELLRLARENAELLHLPDRIRGLREAEAELEALKRRIAEACNVELPGYKDNGQQWWDDVREHAPCGKRVALLPVGGDA